MLNIQPHVKEAMQTTAFRYCRAAANGLQIHFAPDAATHFERRVEEVGMRCYQAMRRKYPKADEAVLSAYGHREALCRVIKEARRSDPERFAPRSLDAAINDLNDEIREVSDRSRAKRIADAFCRSAGGKNVLCCLLDIPRAPKRKGRGRRTSAKPKRAPST